MDSQAIINLLLAVPFNEDYKIPPDIRNKLTVDTFFERCFVYPADDKYLEKSLNEGGDLEETGSFEVDILKEEVRKNLDKQMDEINELHAWIKSRQPDLYCFLGDAGAGKSTYLQYLKYRYERENVSFEIIDIQEATQDVKMLNLIVSIPEFHSLYAKSSAAILKQIADSLFVYVDENAEFIDSSASCAILETVSREFAENIMRVFPREEIEDLFTFPDCTGMTSLEACRQYAKHLANCVRNLFKDLDIKEVFSILVEAYIYLLVCKDSAKDYIISFDNFERFIGLQEIFNSQLTDFVVSLRMLQKNITNNSAYLKHRCQLLICMRHTSVRMFTSEQVTEFMPHTVNIDNWFEPSSMIKKKILWLKEQGVDTKGIKHIPTVLEDMGECGNILRGLHFKISMLFNYNKRVIVTFLVKVLHPEKYANRQMQYIDKYDYFWNRETKIMRRQAKFAARSIIFRLVLNKLHDDGFFKYIMVEEEKQNKKSSTSIQSRRINSRGRLSLARKILTLLYNYDIGRPQQEDIQYMRLCELLSQLYPNIDNPLEMLLDVNNETVFKNIAQILFHMNYYNPREENWLQFIDIQYNVSIEKDLEGRISIKNTTDLQNLIRTHYHDINLRITNAGKAYLHFVIYHFEFFSCRATYDQSNITPPLLCMVPTIEQIKNSDIQNLPCISIIERIKEQALSCISIINQDENPITFLSNGNSISHSQRIVNSHRGYLDNFVACIKSLYAEELKRESEIREPESEEMEHENGVTDLINEITRIRSEYRANYICTEGE